MVALDLRCRKDPANNPTGQKHGKEIRLKAKEQGERNMCHLPLAKLYRLGLWVNVASASVIVLNCSLRMNDHQWWKHLTNLPAKSYKIPICLGS